MKEPQSGANPEERDLVGFEEGYSNLTTSQLKTIEQNKKTENKKAKKKEEYKNTIKPRGKTRTAVLVLGAVALLIGVTLGALNLSEDNSPEKSPEQSEIVQITPETEAQEKATFMLDDVGTSIHYQMVEQYGEESDVFGNISGTIQEEGTILETEVGRNFILSAEISGIPSDFDIEMSSLYFEEPLKEEILWNFEELEITEDIKASAYPGDTILKVIKFNGLGYGDGTPTAVTVIYSLDSEDQVRVKIDVSVLILEDIADAPEGSPAEPKDSAKAEDKQ